MSENRDDNGQFASEEPQVFGAEAELKANGWETLPKAETEELTIDEAASALPDDEEVTVERGTLDPLPDNVALTAEQAADRIKAEQSADTEAADSTAEEDLRTYVDQLRGDEFQEPAKEGIKTDADPKAEKPADAKADEPNPEQLDPDLEKALQHPQVRQAIAAEVNEANTVRQRYETELGGVNAIISTSLFSQVPELQGLAPEHVPGALQILQRTEPAKFQVAMDLLTKATAVNHAQTQIQQQQAAVKQQEFASYAKEQDAAYDEMIKDVPERELAAVQREIIKEFQKAGVTVQEFAHLFNSEPILRFAPVQKALFNSGRLSLIQAAPKAVASRPLPHVQKPGISRGFRADTSATERELDARLSRTGSVKDAEALLKFRLASGR